MKLRIVPVIALAGAFFFNGSAWAADRILAFATIVPLKYMVQQIGNGLVDVEAMVPPGADVHIYEPKPRQMVAVSKADLYFAIGVEFEKRWLAKIVATNEKMKVVHTDRGIKKIPMTAPAHIGGHEPDGHGDHPGENEIHDGLDPHIWLSPPLVMTQARIIRDALQEADPVHRPDYENHYNHFLSALRRLHAGLQHIFAEKQGLQFMVFHPAWGYFAHTYGLTQIPVEIEGKNPKPAQLVKLIRHAKERGIKVLFVQPQFSPRSAMQIAREIGGQVAFVDPLAENWMENIREVAAKFGAALK